MLPAELRDYLPDGKWDIEKLHSLESGDVNVMELEYFFQWLCKTLWSIKDGNMFDFDLKPMDVLRFPEHYKYHHDKIEKADLIYPIDIVFGGNGEMKLLDGLHRIAHAFKYKHKEILARVHGVGVLELIGENIKF